MHSRDGVLQLSATDLSNFLGCKHRTALDMAVARKERSEPPRFEDPLFQLLFDRGIAHEKAYVAWLAAEGLEVVDLTPLNGPGDSDALVAATIEAMQRGAEVIYQGGLRDGFWFGKPDILRRIDQPSELGAWSYEVYDTKLSKKTKAGAILQLSLYSAMVARLQGITPERLFIVAPRFLAGMPIPEELCGDKPCPEGMMVLEYRVNDYAAYFRLIRKRMEETVVREALEVAEANYPDPVSHCAICRWSSTCDDKRHKDDHISLVAGINRTQRRELAVLGIITRTQCAQTWPLPAKPSRGSVDTYENAHHQARLQVASDRMGVLQYELRPIIAARAATEGEPAQLDEGLCRLPEPSPGDIFLDLEGDPYAVEGGREYLIGLAYEKGAGTAFEAYWGFNDADERKSFEQVMDLIAERRAKFPGMHVYHYAPYETTAFRKLRLRYETRGKELDALLQDGVFVDLYAVVRQGVRVGSESYSIKKLEPLYGFDRQVDLVESTRCRNQVEIALQSGMMPDPDIVETVRGYNEEDCVSALLLRRWLEKVRAEHGEAIPRPTVIIEEPREPNEREQRVAKLRERLLIGIPDDRTLRTDEQHARWLLAYLLDYHRREFLASAWEYYRLRELPEDELEDEAKAVTGLAFDARVHINRRRNGNPTGVVVDRYRYPAQEMEIGLDTVQLREGGDFGDIIALDRVNRTIDVKKRTVHAEYHPTSVFAHKHVRTDAQEEALLAIGARVADEGALTLNLTSPDLAARRLLLGSVPKLTSGPLGAAPGDIVEHLTNVVLALDHSVLPVQGPPGAGKTYAGARAICSLVAAGKRVGVTAHSHAVIRNLMDEVLKAAAERGLQIGVGQKLDKSPEQPSAILAVTSNDGACSALNEGAVHVMGGTAWLWSHDVMLDAVDVLVVDEAAQIALANVIAMSRSAKSIVLLGDPQQLEQPRKAAHPDGIEVSVLKHALGGHATVAPDRGVFLPTTWRMCPSITAFTSELFYEDRLSALKGLEHQTIDAGDALSGAGLRILPAEHEGNRSYSDEEVALVSVLVARLTRGDAAWVDKYEERRTLTGQDILVVAPYNAQVSRLVKTLETTGARAGTVDRFQGQEAPIVIYSMATSRAEDAPRGMEFLYSLNRLNVATSRARCVAVVLASPRLLEPECSTPRHMRLANAVCRLGELASLPAHFGNTPSQSAAHPPHKVAGTHHATSA